ncbi:hypothetical protein HWV62_23430 [Athelia sp. TMB]|nr:hypothetical protein HWV62_23424 [Athelia sp. TMB]KAF7983183.1 hypothetical protein HWV62_23430 [Athelia sp. TMB]
MGAALAVYVAFSVEQVRFIKVLQSAATHWRHNMGSGFLIPIGLIFVLTLPPLIEADFIAVFCVVGWGTMGCVFVITGQLLNEVTNYFNMRALTLCGQLIPRIPSPVPSPAMPLAGTSSSPLINSIVTGQTQLGDTLLFSTRSLTVANVIEAHKSPIPFLSIN